MHQKKSHGKRNLLEPNGKFEQHERIHYAVSNLFRTKSKMYDVNWEIAYVKFPCDATVAWNTILKQQIKLKSRPNRQNIWKNYTS